MRSARAVPWMDVDLYADTWPLRRSRDLAIIRFSFHEELGNRFRLSDPSHADLRATMVETIAAYASHHGFGKDDGDTVYYLARKFLRLFRWLEAQGNLLTAVTAAVARQYAAYLVQAATQQGHPSDMPIAGLDVEPSGQVGLDDEACPRMAAATLQSLLLPLPLMWQFRSRLPLQLAEDPFPDGTGVVARAMGLTNRHGEIPSLESGCHLLHGAIKVLTELGPLVASDFSEERAARRYDPDTFYQVNAKAVSLGLNLVVAGRRQSGDPPKLMGLHSIVSDVLPHALMVVAGILAFARPGEVMALKEGSISGGEHGGYWLTRRIGKNYKQDRGVPVSVEVVQAVQVMELLLRDRRDLQVTDMLLPKRRIRSGVGVHLITFTSAGLNRLARIVGVPHEVVDGKSTAWHFEPKQFRMFGACCWVYRFDLPVTALSVVMFHFDWTTTSYYLREPTIRRWVEKFQRRFSLEFVEKAASGSVGFAGLQSKRLVRLVSRLRMTMHVSTSEVVKRVGRALVDDQNLVVMPNAWGYCFAPSGIRHERRSQCMKEGIGRVGSDGRIDSTASRAGVCCGCRFFGSSKSRVPYLHSELKRTEGRACSPRLNETERGLERQRAILLRNLIDELGAPDDGTESPNG